MKKLIALVLCALMLCAIVPFSVSAAGMTVAYVKDGGSGDGTSADKAFGNLQDAYNALDLEKDCTIVICGPYTQSAHFDPWIEYNGNLTITSVYDGVDYRATANAEYICGAYRFFLYGNTKFDNLNFHATGKFVLFVAQCNEIYFGEGFETICDNASCNGAAFGGALSVLGGFQSGAYESLTCSGT